MVHVQVEYCGSWGYEPRYEELARLLREKVPGATVEGAAGRRRSFEVTVDGVLVFSKLERGGFPAWAEVVSCVQQSAEGGKPVTVEGVQPSSCTLL